MAGRTDVPSMQVFDLHDLVEVHDRWARQRRFTYRWCMALMGFCGMLGVYFLLFRPAWSASTFYVVPVELMGMGLILGGLFWRDSRAFGPAPRQLAVTPEFAAFDAVPGRSSFKVAWDDPKLSLTLYDFRALDRTHGDIRSQFVDLLVKPKGRAQTPVPAEAFEAILKQAERHGLAVRHQSIPAGRMGTWDRISVASSPHEASGGMGTRLRGTR